MTDADEFLARVDRQLWAVKLTPRVGRADDSLYVCVIPGGQMVHRVGPSWMNHKCAQEVYKQYTESGSNTVYIVELISQFNMMPA